MEATLHINPNLLGPVSALFGALIGSAASLIAAIYTQRSQDRIQDVAREITKRETVYADFIMTGSNLLLNAYLQERIALSGDEQRLIGLMNRMRLFAPPDVVDEAEAVLKAIIEILLKPRVDLNQLARAVLSKSQDPDPFLTFSLVCRTDLDNVRRAGERRSDLFSNLLGLARYNYVRSKAVQPALPERVKVESV
ncbi:MAG: hypothetical protein JOY65_12955 [Acetobacteraceae bacterium]|nr:hypothetical protein [Acetobacteraceae bacterium]